MVDGRARCVSRAVAMAGRLMLNDVAVAGGMVLLVAALVVDLWARRHPVPALVQIHRKRGA